MNLSKYEIVLAAYKSRLIFRTDKEYRNILGVTYETLEKKKESDREVESYYNALDRECKRMMPDRALEDIANEYAAASLIFLSSDWGDRNQGASRKRFCRMLFRFAATGGRPLSAEEIEKFRNKEDDARLLSIFFPDGIDHPSAVNILYIILFTFDIIKPWTGATRQDFKSKSRQNRDISDKQTRASLSNFHELLTQLRDDTPRMGSTEKPLAFTQWLANTAHYLSVSEDLSNVTPLWMMTGLTDVLYGCQSVTSPENVRNAEERYDCLDMPGIWIDDADGGKDRFWIFPDNMRLSFCYERRGAEWRLIPYSFSCIINDNPELSHQFLFAPSKGIMRQILNPELPLANNELANGVCDTIFSNDRLRKVEFFDDLLEFPDWFEWRSFERLGMNDERYCNFRDVLSGIYDPFNALSFVFTNEVPTATDALNCFIGRDREYLYISDLRMPSRCAISEEKEERFVYEPLYPEGEPSLSLLSLEVSEEHPLYAIPLELKQKSRRGDCWWKLEKLLEYADRIDEAYLYHRDGKAPLLYFPTDYVSVPLEPKKLEEYGIKKIVSLR